MDKECRLVGIRGTISYSPGHLNSIEDGLCESVLQMRWSELTKDWYQFSYCYSYGHLAKDFRHPKMRYQEY